MPHKDPLKRREWRREYSRRYRMMKSTTPGKCNMCGDLVELCSNGRCRPCHAKEERERRNNPEVAKNVRESVKRYRKNNKKWYETHQRMWRENNKEKVSNYLSEWRRSNKDRTVAYAASKRANKSNGEFIDPMEVYNKFGGICQIPGCEVNTPIDLTLDKIHPLSFVVDHIVPLSRGGEHTFDNVQSAHRRCNGRKGTKLVEEMVAHNGR